MAVSIQIYSLIKTKQKLSGNFIYAFCISMAMSKRLGEDVGQNMQRFLVTAIKSANSIVFCNEKVSSNFQIRSYYKQLNL